MERVCITGGKGHLAQAIAAAFSAGGDEVHAPERDELDVTSAASVEAYFKSLPPPDLLVLNAGTAENRLLARCHEDSWDLQMDVNLHGAFRCARAAAKRMLNVRRGHLVFISSHAAAHPAFGQSAYGASKAALHGLALSLARELGAAGIRVNVVLPGFLATPMTADISGPRLDQVLADHVLGHINTPEAVARFLVTLHRDLAHTSGQIFQLDSRPG